MVLEYLKMMPFVSLTKVSKKKGQKLYAPLISTETRLLSKGAPKTRIADMSTDIPQH